MVMHCRMRMRMAWGLDAAARLRATDRSAARYGLWHADGPDSRRRGAAGKRKDGHVRAHSGFSTPPGPARQAPVPALAKPEEIKTAPVTASQPQELVESDTHILAKTLM